MLALALDVLIILLLSGVLGLGLVLHRRLGRFRRETAAFEELIAGLTAATDRAEAALGELKRTAAAAGERLAEEQAGAQRLADDLRLLSGRADQLAERLAELIRTARPLEASAAPGRAVAAPKAGQGEAEDGATEESPRPAPATSPQELERALRTLR